MRILKVWLVATIMLASVTIGWYVSQPIVVGVARNLNSSMTIPAGRNVATGVEYASYAWGPIFDIFILLWALISSQQRDVESEVYG